VHWFPSLFASNVCSFYETAVAALPKLVRFGSGRDYCWLIVMLSLVLF